MLAVARLDEELDLGGAYRGGAEDALMLDLDDKTDIIDVFPYRAGSKRVIASKDFFTGFLESALEPGELLTEIRVPKAPGTTWNYQKFNRRALDWAIVGVAAVSRNGSSGVGLVNMGPTPLRASATEGVV